MKRTLLTLLLAAAALAGASAQTAVERLSDPSQRLTRTRVWRLDTLTLDSLYDRWNDYVLARPKNEQAWRNLFEIVNERSGRYLGNAERASLYKRQKNVVGRMEEAIPETYTFNYCAYESNYEYEKYKGQPYDFYEYVQIRNRYADRAIELLPDDAQADDYERWASYLITQKTGQDTTTLTNVLTRYFESGLYQAEALQYHFNELQGMDEGGIYLGHTEGDVIGKLILQLVKGVHRDKILYCENAASFRPYLEAFFQQAGLSMNFFEPEGEWANTDEQFDELRLITRYICKYAPHPVYTSASCVNNLIVGEGLPEDLKACLYNEGLTMHYSATPYDNQAVKRRNVEERYRLEYLRLSFQPSMDDKNTQRYQQSPYVYSFNYLLLLNDLMPYYKKHAPERFVWLNGLYTDIISQMVRQGSYGLGTLGVMFFIKECEEGGQHFEITQTPYMWDESECAMHLDEKPENTRVLIKTEPITTTNYANYTNSK